MAMMKAASLRSPPCGREAPKAGGSCRDVVSWGTSCNYRYGEKEVKWGMKDRGSKRTVRANVVFALSFLLHCVCIEIYIFMVF